jgi:pimeloyl-ACP methyl ester carboxylesterase
MTTRAVVRDGVRISYRTEGSGGPTVLLLPGFQLIDSRMWDGQMSELARVARVVSYDLRGSGRSSKPLDQAAYTIAELLADSLAVLDAAGADQPAVLVGNSLGGALAYVLAALHPDRVAGIALLAPTVNITGDADAPLVAAGLRFDEDRGGPDHGWARYNRHAWRRDFGGFVEWFVHTASPEPHAAAIRRRATSWGMESNADLLAATVATRVGVAPDEQARTFRTLAGAVRCPALVVHGERDEIVPPAWGRAVAQALDATFVAHPDAGHCPHLSYPAMVNGILLDFLASVTGGGRSAA